MKSEFQLDRGSPALQIWFSVSQYKILVGEKMNLFKPGCNYWNEWLFCGIEQILMFQRDQQSWTALAKFIILKSDHDEE